MGERQLATGVDPRLVVGVAVQLGVVHVFPVTEVALAEVVHHLHRHAGIEDGRRFQAALHGADEHAAHRRVCLAPQCRSALLAQGCIRAAANVAVLPVALGLPVADQDPFHLMRTPIPHTQRVT